MTIDVLDERCPRDADLDALDREGPEQGRADQTVIDAEFLAIVLDEHSWGEDRPSPRTPPPVAATRTRREPPPRDPGPRSGRPRGRRPAVGETPQVRRRVGPGPRSPPQRST